MIENPTIAKLTATVALELPTDIDLTFLVSNTSQLKDFGVENNHITHIESSFADSKSLSIINKYPGVLAVRSIEKDTELSWNDLEKLRLDGCKIIKHIRKDKKDRIALLDLVGNKRAVEAILEGMLLGNYQFDKYKSDKSKLELPVCEILVVSPALTACELVDLNNLSQAVFHTRDLVNEPNRNQSATDLANKIVEFSKEAGFTVDVYNKSKIEALKFGGLLAVNSGSEEPPTFSVLEWKPKNAINSQPYLLVGKGVVFDTGGVNIKTLGMADMKCDMAGAAAVIGTFYAVAKNNLPIHIVGLIPATDNRPGKNAYVPGDVITMHNGKMVEVLNTDAEGRMILADALSYGERFNPLVTIDLATLTGSAAAAIGSAAAVCMGNADDSYFNNLLSAGFEANEKLVRFPFWDEYGKMIESKVGDIKNIGGKEAGSITAGKFLEHFVKSPFIHIDIAGPAFIESGSGYHSAGATGYGVRLLYRYFSELK